MFQPGRPGGAAAALSPGKPEEFLDKRMMPDIAAEQADTGEEVPGTVEAPADTAVGLPEIDIAEVPVVDTAEEAPGTVEAPADIVEVPVDTAAVAFPRKWFELGLSPGHKNPVTTVEDNN